MFNITKYGYAKHNFEMLTENSKPGKKYYNELNSNITLSNNSKCNDGCDNLWSVLKTDITGENRFSEKKVTNTDEINKSVLTCFQMLLTAVLDINIFSRDFQYKRFSNKVHNSFHRSKYVLHIYYVFIFVLLHIRYGNALLSAQPTYIGLISNFPNDGHNNITNNNIVASKPPFSSGSHIPASISSSGYLDKLDNLERSVAAVLIKVAYGTTSTTKRSIPDNALITGLTTIATPFLTTQRFLEKSSQQQQFISHHRNYELDLERDHALPTSAPNADILKSNSNPTYPNPNRYNHDRDRYRHPINSTSLSSLPNIYKKNNDQIATTSLHHEDIPSYHPPGRSFFTPPLPPEYQNPFADKPTLRGTNNEGALVNTSTFVNRRPIPPPSLMPGHERIPYRAVDQSSLGENDSISVSSVTLESVMPVSDHESRNAFSHVIFTTESSKTDKNKYVNNNEVQNTKETINHSNPDSSQNSGKEVLPNIRRILSGSNGNKGDVPEVLFKHVTSRPIQNYHQPTLSTVKLVNDTEYHKQSNNIASSANINKSKIKIDVNSNIDGIENINMQFKTSTKSTIEKAFSNYADNGITSTPAAAAAIGEAASSTAVNTPTSSVTSMPSIDGYSTWTIALNVHVYLSVILFTILLVYSFYKMLTYNKLTHLFSQSYFLCIHIILISICSTRIFYLCYDAYNIHSTFHIFISEILLNLPATFLTVCFSVLILYLFLKSLNHKNNRYSSLIRPLTVIVGCGVHVVLCITLHYVESYTMQNHQQQLYYQQQFYRRQQHQYQSQLNLNQVHQKFLHSSLGSTNNMGSYLYTPGGTSGISTSPPRVLSLICQVIYIFVCISLGLLYLYLYRILKRILRNKSQNYIHCYQNLSYAIHITIATALLFILLAVLQIFGAISISTTRPLITHINSEIDWLQWGYQFSLRLIEIAIITLISWVTGLKISNGSSVNNIANVDVHLEPTSGGPGGVFGSNTSAGNREKQHSQSNHNHSNVAGFFLPCTTTSSQEQFETDYPAVCNTNTNLHTYTMRTGKLIYDDTLALSSLTSPTTKVNSSNYQLHHSTYQQPYDNSLLHNSYNHNIKYSESNGYGQDRQQCGDYFIDATNDHYENPNFELGSSGTIKNNQKIGRNSTNSTTASSSACSSSGLSVASQQQILLQSENSYSEPLNQTCDTLSSYNFNNFERPKFSNNRSENHQSPQQVMPFKREKKSCTILEKAAYENSKNPGYNMTQFVTNNSEDGRYSMCNSFDRGQNGVRKSGTLNNSFLGKDGVVFGGRNSSSTTKSSNILHNYHHNTTGVQNISVDRHPQFHGTRNARTSGRSSCTKSGRQKDSDVVFERATIERVSSHNLQQHPFKLDDDMMLADSNVERTNLINNEDGSCILNSKCESNPVADISVKEVGSNTTILQHLKNKSQIPCNDMHCQSSKNLNEISNSSSDNSNNSNNSVSVLNSNSENISSDDILIAELGFVRFRPLDDINNAQGVGIHNASLRNQKHINVSTQNFAFEPIVSAGNSKILHKNKVT
ncbi:uncharacterized protein LOC119684786 [Teleopsis dalmanni]|uniref:uncharacterized protein LOC119684786 n=1 Tax=Teleopsis dalmanni TaxID=139649 RepID=UPI0018CE24DB|nr:uncharacterized protein LOC119684786 [Teleopsis dalmanni]